MSNKQLTINEQVKQMYKERGLQLDDTVKTIEKVLANKNHSTNTVITSRKLQKFVVQTWNAYPMCVPTCVAQ